MVWRKTWRFENVSNGSIFSDFLFCVVFCVLYLIVCYMYLPIWAAYLGQDTLETEIVMSVSFLSWLNKGYNNNIKRIKFFFFFLQYGLLFLQDVTV